MKRNSLPKKRTISCFLVVFLAFCCSQCNSVETTTRPNIIFILVDALRADYLGYQGFEGDISPNIDAFAKSSTVFTSCYAQASWTKPSVASIFTSKNPVSHRCFDSNWKERVGKKLKEFQKRREETEKRGETNPLSKQDQALQAKEIIKVEGKQVPLIDALDSIATDTLPLEEVTLAEVLQSHGYRTASFVGGNEWVSQKTQMTQGFDFETVEYVPGCPYRNCALPAEPLTDMAMKWVLDEKGEKPFFLYLHYMDVHSPYKCTPNDFFVMKDSPSLGPDRRVRHREFEILPWHLANSIAWRKDTPTRKLLEWKACYAAGIRQFDRIFGKIMQDLERQGILDNTLVVFTADHGEEFLEHGKWAHGKNLHTEELNVPLIIKYPSGKYQGRRIDATVSLIDVMPTLLSATGVTEVPESMQGHDLSPLISKGSASETRYAFSAGMEHYPYRVAVRNDQFSMMFDLRKQFEVAAILDDPKFKWNFPRKQRGILFDRKDDNEEQNDIFLKKPEEVKKLTTALNNWFKQVKPPKHKKVKPKKASWSKEELERLRSLGYMK